MVLHQTKIRFDHNVDISSSLPPYDLTVSHILSEQDMTSESHGLIVLSHDT
jgi:hypothetical protein